MAKTTVSIIVSDDYDSGAVLDYYLELFSFSLCYACN